MTALDPNISIKSSARESWIDRMHRAMQSRWIARILFCLAATCLFFLMYLLLEWPHLGSRARLHWDAESSICADDPMPTAAQLAEARLHVFDLLAEVNSSDPAVISRYFSSPFGSARHGPLETVRRYYSQISFVFARLAFHAGARWTGSPVGAIWAFQLSAVFAVSLSMALLLTYVTASTPAGFDLRFRLSMLLLAFTAIATQVIFLSIARQMLTETISFLFWSISILLLVAAIKPSRSLWIAGLYAAAAGGGFFLTLRARFNLGPAVALILPLVFLLHLPLQQLVSQWRRYVLLATLSLLVFAACVIWDVQKYGPFFTPWVYNQTLVRSTYLYFHAEPPYQLFLVMLYNNFPLLFLPLLGVCAAFTGRIVDFRNDSITLPQLRIVRFYAAITLVILAGLIALMARQQVVYQGRHLFALSAAAVLVLLLTIGRVRWGKKPATVFATVCSLVILCNIHSTFGPQVVTQNLSGPPIIRPTLQQRLASNRPRLLLLKDLFDGYFEWSDVRRLHDPLLVAQFIQAVPNRPLLVINVNTYAAWRVDWFVKRFAVSDITYFDDRDRSTSQPIQAALSAGRSVYFLTPRDGKPLTMPFTLKPENVVLDSASLFAVRASGSIAAP